MTLIFDNRANLQGQPGLHALIAGISAYGLKENEPMNNFFNGMTRSNKRPDMARTQLYFVDVDRTVPHNFSGMNWDSMNTTDVWDIGLSGDNDRYAPIFYAAIPGGHAYQPKDERQTIFSKALLHCLKGAALGDWRRRPLF